jgi:hypothetical protein
MTEQSILKKVKTADLSRKKREDHRCPHSDGNSKNEWIGNFG